MNEEQNMAAPLRCALIDNYDSFTYNPVHLIRELGAEVTVFSNDGFTLAELEPFDKLILSPGPGLPSEAGLLYNVIREYSGRKPMLGVCLGHQAIAEVFGAHLEHLSDVFHGIATEGSQVAHDPIFAGLPPRFMMGRYHSWTVSHNNFPACLEVTAETPDGLIMALRHREYDIHGIQFHPESVLTTVGSIIMRNWLQLPPNA